MAERLATALKAVLERKGDINAVVSALEKAAPTSREREENSSVDHYNNLVAQYRESQSLQKGAYSKSKKASVAKPSTPFFSLNFAKYRRNLKGYAKTTPNTQVIGFTDDDTHRDVLVKGARGLGISSNVDDLSILC